MLSKVTKIKKAIEELQVAILDSDLSLKEDINLTLREAWYYTEVAGQLMSVDICLGE